MADASFVIFISVTNEAWTGFMYHVMHATTPFACIYFIFIIRIGNLFTSKGQV